MKKILIGLTMLFLVLVSSGFEAGPKLNVDLINSEGNKVGTASLSETPEGVKILIKAEGLEPGVKAIHIHQTALCEKPDFETAGPHFNPFGKEHGFENPKGFHAGDLPNLKIGEDGKVEVEIVSAEVTLIPGKENSLLDEDGSSIIIHEKADDYKTDPSGNSGKRIVCGAISK